jgi:hypothetical protein
MTGPVLHMWGTGELRREFVHVNGRGAMKISRPLEPGAVPAVIMLDNMHVYYPVDDEEFMANSPIYTALALGHLRLPLGYSPADLEKTLRRFVEYVQDGFDELKKMKPGEDRKEVVGEYTAVIGGEKISGEVMQ